MVTHLCQGESGDVTGDSPLSGVSQGTGVSRGTHLMTQSGSGDVFPDSICA